MSTIYNGQDTFGADKGITSNRLNTIAVWHGTTLPTSPTNEVPQYGLFLKTDTGIIYENTGTLGSPTWTARTGSQPDGNAFSAAGSWAPIKQTGLGQVILDATLVTAGICTITLDGVETVVPNGTIVVKAFNTSTSVSVAAADGTIADFTYSTYSYNFTAEVGIVRGIFWKPDGTKIYVIDGAGNGDVYQYSVSTPWRISTASYDSKTYNPTEDLAEYGLAFSSDGTKMYVSFDWIGSDGIYQYTLSTAWDISTASYAGKVYTPDNTSRLAFCFNAAGTKLYVLDDSDVVEQATLSTAWDISTASSDFKELDTSGEDTSPRAIALNADGTKLLFSGNISHEVHSYTLATPYDISTATYDEIALDHSPEGTATQGGLAYGDSDSKLYVAATGAIIFQYDEDAFAGSAIGYVS